jgi:DNA-binding MarR family transcriptional regulator
LSKTPTPPQPRDELPPYSDLAFEFLAAEISGNYLKLIKTNLIPQLGEHAGFPLRELRTLMSIAYFDYAVTGAKIVRMLGYDPATVTRSTRWLIKENFVISEVNTEDARSVVYCLTEQGTEVAEKFRRVSIAETHKLDAADAASFSPEEVINALRIMTRIRNRSRLASKLAI